MLERKYTRSTQLSRRHTKQHRSNSGFVCHAWQVVQFFVNTLLDASKLAYKLNRLLPADVRVTAAMRTAPDFDVTCTAVGKVYRYFIETGPVHDPMKFRYRLHHPKPLDVAAMRAAAQVLVGTHDFTQFSNETPERLKRNPVKTIRRHATFYNKVLLFQCLRPCLCIRFKFQPSHH